MKTWLIFKKLEDGSYEAAACGSYQAATKDDSSANRSYLHAEPLASHFEMPEGADPDCCVLQLVPEIPGTPEVPQKWVKEGEPDSPIQPMIDQEPDMSYTFVPAVPAVTGIPAHYIAVEDAVLKAAKVQQAQAQHVQEIYDNAVAFGNGLIREFTTENMMMGITADGKTSAVRKTMTEVILALQTGSLYDAIAEAKLIPQVQKDSKYITDARLLVFINKIETYLGIALSQSL